MSHADFVHLRVHSAYSLSEGAVKNKQLVELAKRNSRQRIDPLIDESPELRERVKPARSRDAGNTMLSKEFAGGILIMTGANSAVGLRSTPARYIFLDEVDAYPASADEEGDPVTLAEARSLTFAHRRKALRGSLRDLAGGSGPAEAALLAAGIDPLTRGEALGIDEFVALTIALEEHAAVDRGGVDE